MKIYSQRLTKLDLLSRGQESEVWLARDDVSGAKLILKTVHPLGGEPDEEFADLIRLSRSLGDSGFLPADDVIVSDEGPASYTSRHIEAGSLSVGSSQLEDTELLEVLQYVCQALAYLHSLDYLHCDIKPDNILIERVNGAVKPHVTDLGLAVRRGSQFPTTIRGTDQFIAPEQREGKPLTEAADVYSFGRMLARLTSVVKSDRVSAGLKDLSERCSQVQFGDRPQSFWEVHDVVRRLSVSVFGAGQWVSLMPPLRDTGVRLRLASLRRQLEPQGERSHGLCLVAGAPGGGKSKILGEHALDRQFEGEETIRVTGVGSADELIAGLPKWVAKCRDAVPSERRRPLTIVAETTPECRFSQEDLGTLDTLAAQHSLALLLECHDSRQMSVPGRIPMIRARPLTLRECIVASSHLQDGPSLATVNGRALHFATGGSPWLVRQFLRTWLANRIRNREGEPINFDRLDLPTAEYWSRRFSRLPMNLRSIAVRASVFHDSVSPELLVGADESPSDVVGPLEELVERGWLQKTGTGPDSCRYSFLCRSARNVLRCQMGREELRSRATEALNDVSRTELPLTDRWELHRLADEPDGRPTAESLWQEHRTLADTKLATFALLERFRHSRRASEETLSSLASRIGDGLSQLGSVSRQKRWAAIAFDYMRKQTTPTGMSLDVARSRCRLYDLLGDLPAKKQSLTTHLNTDETSDAHVRGFLLSELGATHLLLSDFSEANACCFEAHHLLEKAAPTSEEYVRGLNRLGLSLMRIGRFTAARRYFEGCRRLASELGFDHVGWLSSANLVLLLRSLGDPMTAMRCSRHVIQDSRLANEPFKYLSALQDRVLCLVDLGRWYPAMRSARLAVWLSNQYSDPVQQGWALNNLGWVLSMQGEVGQAQRHLEAAVRSRLRIGDLLWAARSRLNIAWNLLHAAKLEEARRHCQVAMDEISRKDDVPGLCEAARIMARLAMMRSDSSRAEEHLSEIPRDEPRLSPRERTEISLAWLDHHLWVGQEGEAEQLLNALIDDPIVANVYPLRCDFGRLRGHWCLLRGEFDEALAHLGRTAAICRRGGRIDKLLDTMLVQVLLAAQVRNWPVALRYLRTIRKLINNMRGQLQCTDFSMI